MKYNELSTEQKIKARSNIIELYKTDGNVKLMVDSVLSKYYNKFIRESFNLANDFIEYDVDKDNSNISIEVYIDGNNKAIKQFLYCLNQLESYLEHTELIEIKCNTSFDFDEPIDIVVNAITDNEQHDIELEKLITKVFERRIRKTKEKIQSMFGNIIETVVLENNELNDFDKEGNII